MIQTVEIYLHPSQRHDQALHRTLIAEKLKLPVQELTELRLERCSIDARKRQPRFLLRYRVAIGQQLESLLPWQPKLNNVKSANEVVVIGAGPAGLFAALKLIELGLKPIVLERGKSVRERRRDIAALTKQGIVNPESNYCFGEGGAGTFSDGKLYTRSHKRGSVERILQILHYHGASSEILIDAHPHVGTNKLPAVIQAIRETIISCGGEVHFEAKVTEFIRNSEQITALKLNNRTSISCKAVILATGHSARDVFTTLAQSKIAIEAKPFALGVRIEHPQSLIDSAQYHCQSRDENLPAASYSLVAQVEQRGVFSFCMCPGGIICPAATNEGEVVTNGWSPSKRNSYFANSGVVIEITAADWKSFADFGPLAALKFQSQFEKRAFELGGGRQVAPAQRLTDLIANKASTTLPRCSYLPGVTGSNLSDLFPRELIERLKNGIVQFDKSIKGYLTEDAIAVGVESRTSSPVRIPRDRESLMHIELEGLFPCGEGAGYAGGILSAAMDGEKVAAAAQRYLAR